MKCGEKMTRVTKKDVWCLIDSLNQKYGLDDTTPCKFYLLEAYGGCQIVLKKKGSGSVTDITYGYLSPRETIDDFYRRKGIYGEDFVKEKIRQFIRY